MIEKSFTPEMIAARRAVVEQLDRISPGTYGANTNLVEAIEALIRRVIEEALERIG